MTNGAEIRLGEARVLGVDREASGLLNVEVPLEPRPDRFWLQIFESGPPGPMWPVSMHPPRLSGATVQIRPPDAELEMYLDRLRERVEATNAYYAREVAPELERQQKAAEDQASEDQRRIEEAQRRLDERE